MLVTLFMSAFFGFGGVIAGSCEPPEVENGEVSGKGDGNSWTGTFSCKNGFALVGDRRLKCRRGAWSSTPPLCAGGNCDSSLIPKVEHARLHSYQPLKYRGSVFAYKCNPGFKKVGRGKVVCEGKSWGLGEPTVCAKQGCDETSVNAIPFGHVERKADGAVFSFRCEEGGVLEGSPLLFCNGTQWNGSAPQCMRAVLTPSLTLEPGEGPFKVSQAVSVVCIGQEVEPPSTMTLELVKEKSNSTLVLGLSSDGHLSIDISEYLVPDMHGSELRCIASNGEGSTKQTKQAEIKLDILHGPERVSLVGPEKGPPGTKVEFKCSTSPSNPPAKLKWQTARDAIIRHSPLFHTKIEVGEPTEVWTGTGWETHSSAKVILPEDNPARLFVMCIAENPRIENRDVSSERLVKIYYPPRRVKVEGPKKVAQGEKVSLQCKSDPALPPPSLHWTIRRNGKEEVLETDELNYQGAFAYGGGPNVGASMISDLSFSAGPPGELEVECYAEHETLGENRKTFSHVIEIIEKSLEETDGEAAKSGETEKEEETSDEHKSSRDMNEPKEGEVKSASTSQGSQVDQSLKLIILPLCWTLLLVVKVQTF